MPYFTSKGAPSPLPHPPICLHLTLPAFMRQMHKHCRASATKTVIDGKVLCVWGGGSGRWRQRRVREGVRGGGGRYEGKPLRSDKMTAP